jgi:alkylation response protein AidB-like acyl-CoA dehydrogenase
MKLIVSEFYATGGDLIVELQGAAGTLSREDAPFDGRFQDFFMSQWAPRIGGGTDQVQRNIIGERVLGLPAEVRLDKDVPFRDLARA